MLVEYFGGSKSIPHQPIISHVRGMACVAAKWVSMNLLHPTHYSKSVCKHFKRKHDMITSWKIFPANLMIKRTIVAKSLSGCNRGYFPLEILEFVCELWMKIYAIQPWWCFQHQQLNCCFKSLLRLTTKKTSRHRISGLSWGDCDWIAVLPKHHSQLYLTWNFEYRWTYMN